MARPVRVDVEGGWYHITARGIERRAIFEDVRDHAHFIELLPEMSERYGVEIHAYVLMVNHYHLLIRTPNANASAAVQWLNVSYSVWFNRRRNRVGHVFQGRFASVLIDGEGSWAMAASVYIHLNPVRVKKEGLGKASNRAESRGLKPLSREVVKRRLKKLRTFRWSSYGAYAGYKSEPEWLMTKPLLERGGGRSAYRRYVQRHVTRGETPEGYEDFGGRVALGSQAFLMKAKGWVGKISKEQPDRVQMMKRVSPDAVVKVVEQKRGEAWPVFADRHGDWGRELVLYLARRRCGLTLSEIGQFFGIAEYKAVSSAVKRFEAAIEKDVAKRRMVKECLLKMEKVET
ncbi:MAG: transposase [bacterium]